MSTYTIRPSSSEKEAFRIKLTATSLLSLKLRPGDLCTLHSSVGDETSRVAIAWENSGNGMKDTIVQTSRTLQGLYGLKLGDRVTIRRSAEKLQDADIVVLKGLDAELTADEQAKWSLFASSTIPSKHDILAPRQKVVIEIGTQKNEFEVASVGHSIARVTSQTIFKFDSEGPKNDEKPELRLDFGRAGGIQPQIEQLKSFVERIIDPQVKKYRKHAELRLGLLLYGTKGTGKSMLQNAVAQSSWSRVVKWSPGIKVTTVTEPQLILIEFNKISGDKITSEILTIFDTVRDSPTLVLGSVRHPNEISEQLRSQDAFSLELELPIPDREQRYQILSTLVCEDSVQPSAQQLANIAGRTHGFVGADLNVFLEEMWNNVIERQKREIHGAAKSIEELPTIESQDIEHALSRVRPSALQEIFLEKPNVRWSDIGGQHDIKRQLQNAVERPLKHPELMRALGLQPKKGVLLYGPPGCSKTLTVKALATEAGLNFLAVKGAELVSMYVGESEKATREVFRKARQARPAIIFFDEIDAIAHRGRSGSDLNILTTLLNEMDGFEELKGVLVIAATNKPQEIDPALLRPGRFDNVVYIGPPDLGTRKEIFDKRFAKISVDSLVRTSTERFASSTEGYSGAEVVAICQAAGESAFDHERDHITEGDVIAAITSTPKGISKEMLDEYQAWNSARTR